MINGSVDPVRKVAVTIAGTTENGRFNGGLTRGELIAHPTAASSVKPRPRCPRWPCGFCRTREPLKA